MNTKVKKEDGFTSVDIGIAMMIVVIFASIMASMLYSVYYSQTEAKRTAIALNYAVDIFEEIGRTAYVNVTEDRNSKKHRRYRRIYNSSTRRKCRN